MPTVLARDSLVRHVSVIDRPPTWRGTSLRVSYVFLEREPSGTELYDVYDWALRENLANARVISPFTLQWSSLFNPRFYHAAARAGRAPNDALESVGTVTTAQGLQQLWFESVIFLASVTLSAAIVQSRFSAGTLASKYDRLWQAGGYALEGMIPGLDGQALQGSVLDLSRSTTLPDLDRLLAIRRGFETVLARVGGSASVTETLLTTQPLSAELRARFGFLDDLKARLGSELECVIVYGSSIDSANFADFDLVLVVKDSEAVLRLLANTSPTFGGKELNVGVYSAAELWQMQLLSGDNLADYGLCLHGEARVPVKSTADLMLRNLSFGMVRQRQQLGMIGPAMTDALQPGDDRRNLYEYFVKIPANIAKGTFGVMNERLPKDAVHAWLQRECGFATTAMQTLAGNGEPGRALAASAVATGATLRALNDRFTIVRPASETP